MLAVARGSGDVEQIAKRMEYYLAPPNKVLMQTGDEADKCYLVLRGSLQVLVDGKVVATTGPGEAFGEMALLANEKRSADVVAMQLCELASIHREDCARA
jgi:CRP-like cAMP-binding protein